MTTATATIDTTNLSAADARAAHLKHHNEASGKMIPVTGRTYPIRKVLWTLGGSWNKETECWEVPEHNAAKAQEIANNITTVIETNMQECAAKKAKAEKAKANRAAASRSNLEKARAKKAERVAQAKEAAKR